MVLWGKRRRESEGQGCECSREEAWAKHTRTSPWAAEPLCSQDQLLTCVWDWTAVTRVVHCPSHPLPPFWALSALSNGQEACLEHLGDVHGQIGG